MSNLTPKSKAKAIGAAVALVLGAIVVFQNTETVQTRILFATVEMPRALLLALTLALGLVGGWLLGRRSRKPHAKASSAATE